MLKEKLRKEIGQRLRELRKKMGMTQEQMIQYSDIDIGRANLSRIEKGEVFPGLSLLKNLQNKFNLNINWVLCETGEMFIKDSVPEPESDSFGKNKEEVTELLHHMAKIPALKHAVLSFFFEYKEKNKKLFK